LTHREKLDSSLCFLKRNLCRYAAGARALRGLLLQNPPACREAMEKGGLEVRAAQVEFSLTLSLKAPGSEH
jgi:hypothetical protein